MGLTSHARADALNETLELELPDPIGTLTLVASNRAFSVFRRLTRERGMGPIGPLDETGQLVPGARPRGIDLREAHEWHYVDVESFPLLLWAFAQQRHSQLALELVEEYCTPAVQEQIVTPVVRYATRVLLRILAQAPADGGAGDADPTPASAPETRSGTIGQSGRTASAS